MGQGRLGLSLGPESGYPWISKVPLKEEDAAVMENDLSLLVGLP